ncbi:MAG: methionyl-tRNA formyltransferase [Pseudohongiellaceae bacterium]
MTSHRLVFAGTPEFAARHLQALADSHHEVVAVYTQPDRATGRGRKQVPGPVKSLATSLQLPVYQPLSLRETEAQQTLASHQADLMIVVAYGLILPQAVLDIPQHGCLNVHASLLPRWRGAAPVERALLAGDRETGVTIMQMDAGLDTGAMLYKVTTPIHEHDTRETLAERLAELGCEALLHTLDQYALISSAAQPQDETLSTYAGKLEKSEALINWQEPARMIDRRIRAGVGRLPASTGLDDLRIQLLEGHVMAGNGTGDTLPGTILSAGRDGLDIACGEGVLRLTRLQLPGKKPASVGDILNARRAMFEPGRRFTCLT